LDSLTVKHAQEWRRQHHFWKNAGNDPITKDSTLGERIAITIMHELPDAEPSQILHTLKDTIVNLRTNYRIELQAAMQNNMDMSGAITVEPAQGLSRANQVPAPVELAQLPIPAPEDYLLDDKDVARYLFHQELPDYSELPPSLRKEARRQIRDRSRKFAVRDGRLFLVERPPTRQNQVPKPTTYREVLTAQAWDEVLEHLHDYNGHPSMGATHKLIKDRFWWPKNIHADVGDYVRSCHYCQITNQPTTERTDGRTLTSTEVDMPMEKIGFDLLGPFSETPGKYKYVYVWYDLFSGWVGAGLGTSKDTKEIARFLKLDLFAGHGCPGLAIMDHDAYVGEVRELFDGMGTEVQTIVPYSPYQNGGTEAIVKLLTKSTRKLVLQYAAEQWADVTIVLG
jgi:hypothetical protein